MTESRDGMSYLTSPARSSLTGTGTRRSAAGTPGALFLGSDETASRAQVVAERVEKAILHGELKAAHRLGTKAELQRELGVALGTLNEALRLLQTRGLVEIRPGPGGGVFVASDSAPRVRLRHGILRFHDGGHAVQDCLAVRNALEELVAVEAATSHEPADLEDLYSILDRMARNAHDPAQFVQMNWLLHRRIAEVGGNAVLTSVYRMLLDVIGQALEETRPDEVFAEETGTTLRIHRNLVDAIASGDPDRAAKAARDHTPAIIPVPENSPQQL